MKKTFIAVFVISFMFPSISFCEITNEIRYNGRLKGYTVPLSGNARALRFEYFNSATGGMSLYYEEHTVTPNADGVFSVILKPDIEWQKYKDIWLQLSIDNRPMTPREKIMTQPYAQHAKTSDNGVLPGTIIAYAVDISDNDMEVLGYLPCDGTQRKIANYKRLAEILGSRYGSYDGTYFTLPDFRGMFLRGNGTYGQDTAKTPTQHPSFSTSTVYQSASIGQMQGDAIRNMEGIAGANALTANNWAYIQGVFADAGSSGDNGSAGSPNGSSESQGFSFSAARVVPTSNENRPVNYSVNYYIKY
ncbi:MAG: phage tail protein [Endomicrobium sp.]|jgi:hypothetical protein|nr:phage tail protein [Endomicrobium sp.]